ncbi:divergent PAP2 family protein, partial [Lacrimispora sp.]
MTFWEDLLGNQVLITGVAGWMVAQVLKTIIDLALNKNFNPERLLGSGG